MISRKTTTSQCVIAPLFLFALFVVTVQIATAQTLTALYSFTGSADGGNPTGTLVLDSQGNLYGTTEGGGVYSSGTAFEVTPNGTKTVLHSFGRHVTLSRHNDGAIPFGALVADGQGNLYGTTSQGGAPWNRGYGTVFKLSPSGQETILHSFAGAPNDGSGPEGGSIFDAQGNLYGTTYEGGPYKCDTGTCGTVFKLAPDGTETVLHNFAGSPNDGSGPQGGLVSDAQGNLYGTTAFGGTYSNGTVFKITPSGKETVLYNFAGFPDGSTPQSGLIIDKKGNLYGATFEGGALNNCEFYAGCGAVFELTPQGKETLLHSFAGPPNDGAIPMAALAFDTQGNLYGTTHNGGPSNAGTVFEITPNGTETILYSFTAGADGGYPFAGVVLDSQGNLYGTTFAGAFGGECVSGGCGTVFKLTP